MEEKSPKNIDKLFKNKLGNFEYTHKDSSWQLMNRLMKENSSKKKYFFYRLGLLFTVIGAIALYFTFNFNSKNLNELADNQKKSLQKSTNSDSVELKNKPTKTSKKEKKETPENLEFINNNKKSTISTSESFSFTKTKQIKTKEPLNYNEEIISTSDVIMSVENQISSKNNNYLESSAKEQYVNWNQKKIKANINNIGKHINSSFADYAPVINADGSIMYFTSRRPITEKQKIKNRVAPESIYATSFDAEKKIWTKPKLLAPPINEPNRFNSIVGISNDGGRMLLYRDDKYGDGNIFESFLNGQEWSTPVPLPEPINSKHIETSASLSPDGKTIYFVSNRSGGQGNLDIWHCTKNSQGQWGEAKNLGDLVNTPEKEEGVFIHPDGKTLYFSSKGHGGEGGYDIFYTQLQNGEWTKPQNLGDAVNSPDDDVYFVMEANGKIGYYSSVREGGMGEKDIYRIEFSSPEKELENGPLLTLFKGFVIDKESSQPLKAEIVIVDLEKNEQITTLNTNSSSGSFLISLPSGKNYGINVKKEGYLFYSDNMNIPTEASYKEIIKTVMLEKLKMGSKIILRNIFYDYDKATLRDESKNELDRLYDLLTKNPNLKVELSSHTDSRGSDAYNLKLSQERAQSCVDYLIIKGIAKARIIAKGYGEQALLRSDEEINQQQTKADKENLYLENRRTEFKILENSVN
jgi:outer membrane protein OmpA-like peptidoglycan-associated protein/Tol biopolymer transport system component